MRERPLGLSRARILLAAGRLKARVQSSAALSGQLEALQKLFTKWVLGSHETAVASAGRGQGAEAGRI